MGISRDIFFTSSALRQQGGHSFRLWLKVFLPKAVFSLSGGKTFSLGRAFLHGRIPFSADAYGEDIRLGTIVWKKLYILHPFYLHADANFSSQSFSGVLKPGKHHEKH